MIFLFGIMAEWLRHCFNNKTVHSLVRSIYCVLVGDYLHFLSQLGLIINTIIAVNVQERGACY